MTWQPLETAPKDGTQIRAFDGEAIAAVMWIEDCDFDGGYGWTDRTVASWGMQHYWQMKPTHWMPLPPPPDGSCTNVAATQQTT
jgi:hypothetical protein